TRDRTDAPFVVRALLEDDVPLSQLRQLGVAPAEVLVLLDGPTRLLLASLVLGLDLFRELSEHRIDVHPPSETLEELARAVGRGHLGLGVDHLALALVLFPRALLFGLGNFRQRLTSAVFFVERLVFAHLV